MAAVARSSLYARSSTVAHCVVLFHEERIRGVQRNAALSECSCSADHVVRSRRHQLTQIFFVLRDVESHCARNLSGSLLAGAEMHHSESEFDRQRREEQVLPLVLFAYN